MLSRREREELERIGGQLSDDDPELAEAFGRGGPPRRSPGGRVLRRALELFAGALIVLGLVTLNFGLVLVAAFVLVAAAFAHAQGWGEWPGTGEPNGGADAAGPPTPPAGN
ncbi:hypothetical protein BJF85_20060 [Saccharomonospora sp. CUA-673]|uniref:DUF3040 domain-containing protein n=1 Tax=Saccharomonospora sp. CUA-673 TaxID=1904969 RepID=UPI00095D648D|nr:DUF3040 domain-containing protein [Saccharomonospora sp. CUA-673]OLT44598.1 hypothetical protein BJF85_20060 [Saccharomonospora sp. CUA-673]